MLRLRPSVASPIGNPRNLLIAVGGNVENPFLTFLRYLFVPTVIIIQNAERRAGATITFLEFARVGIPLALVNVPVYWLFLEFF